MPIATTSAAGSTGLLVISTPSGTTDDRSVVIDGTSRDASGAARPGTSVDIDEDGVSSGTASVGAGGRWSAQVLLRDLGPNTLTARTIGDGSQTVTSAPVVLTLGVVQSPSSGPSGADQGMKRVVLSRDAEVSGTDAAETFVFQPHTGHAVVEGFALSGTGADRLSLPHRAFRDISDVLRHTTVSGNDVVIHLSPRDSVTITGVSKAQLRADSGALLLHP